MSLPHGLSELWRVADAIAGETGSDPRYVFDPCGLLLEQPPRPWDYHCSPRNALTFASTGGDGVHFGLLQGAEAPIVMTVPMSDAANIIVAETFEEFLGLGYRIGWFFLEQLAYDPVGTVDLFSRADPDSPECAALLERLRTDLRLTHAPLSIDRITHLRKRYASWLQLPDEKL